VLGVEPGGAFKCEPGIDFLTVFPGLFSKVFVKRDLPVLTAIPGTEGGRRNRHRRHTIVCMCVCVCVCRDRHRRHTIVCMCVCMCVGIDTDGTRLYVCVCVCVYG
jgi:hypothetical protein